MKYVHLAVLSLFFFSIISVDALIQTYTIRDYRLVLSTSPEQPVVNTPVHLELHIQNMRIGQTVQNLNVDGLIVHLEEHAGTEPHTYEKNLSDIHKDISHRILVEMKESSDHPPGHYHTNYTFNETGIYEVIFQFQDNGSDVFSVFSVDIRQKKIEREPLSVRYDIYRVIGASVIVLAAFAFAVRKVVDILNL
jgi:hypothetical protein